MAAALGGCAVMRTIVLIDGQNLFPMARRAWASGYAGESSLYAWPSYDVANLANALVSRIPGLVLSEIRFYTGVPDPKVGPDQRFWHGFWTYKLRSMQNDGVYVYRGRVSSGGQEKGVDVSLALDLVKAAYAQLYDAAIIVSQDWDFGPAVRLAREIAQAQNRPLTIESAYPVGPGSSSRRGIPGTTWIPISQATYDSCIDPADYRPA